MALIYLSLSKKNERWTSPDNLGRWSYRGPFYYIWVTRSVVDDTKSLTVSDAEKYALSLILDCQIHDPLCVASNWRQ